MFSDTDEAEDVEDFNATNLLPTLTVAQLRRLEQKFFSIGPPHQSKSIEPPTPGQKKILPQSDGVATTIITQSPRAVALSSPPDERSPLVNKVSTRTRTPRTPRNVAVSEHVAPLLLQADELVRHLENVCAAEEDASIFQRRGVNRREDLPWGHQHDDVRGPGRRPPSLSLSANAADHSTSANTHSRKLSSSEFVQALVEVKNFSPAGVCPGFVKTGHGGFLHEGRLARFRKAMGLLFLKIDATENRGVVDWQSVTGYLLQHMPGSGLTHGDHGVHGGAHAVDVRGGVQLLAAALGSRRAGRSERGEEEEEEIVDPNVVEIVAEEGRLSRRHTDMITGLVLVRADGGGSGMELGGGGGLPAGAPPTTRKTQTQPSSSSAEPRTRKADEAVQVRDAGDVLKKGDGPRPALGEGGDGDGDGQETVVAKTSEEMDERDHGGVGLSDPSMKLQDDFASKGAKGGEDVVEKETPAAQLYATASLDGTAKLWNAETLRPLRTFNVRKSKKHLQCTAAAFLPVSGRLVISCNDGAVLFFDNLINNVSTVELDAALTTSSRDAPVSKLFHGHGTPMCLGAGLLDGNEEVGVGADFF